MKKIFLSLLLISTSAIGFAQKAPVKFGVKAGVAFPSMAISASGASISFDAKTSFYVGGTADIPVSNILSVQPGLIYVNKGTKLSGGGLDFDDTAIESGNGTLNIAYIEVPVNLVAKFNVATAGKIFVGAGPYYAFAVEANGKVDGEKESITLGSGEDNLKRGDFGLNFLAGFELQNGLNIHAGYGLGLSSVLNDQDNVKFKNKVFSIGLGFTF